MLVEAAKAMRIMFYGVGPQEMAEHAEAEHVPAYLLHAIPLFVLMMAAEFLVGLAQGKVVYRVNDTIASVLLGSLQTLVGSWFTFVNVAAYAFIYEHLHIVEVDPASWTLWVAAVLGVELGYYWLHRTAHEYHVLWIGHSVHHSGEDYNLGTALRQGVLQSAYGFIFMLPVALYVPPLIFAHHKALNTLFQFWIHTTVVGSLGPIEYIFNTPSHHRMHHRPPGNCNYGGVLIVYDRLFGTFVPEDEQKDTYGLAKQYTTFDPVWANVEHGRRMLANIGRNKVHDWRFYLSLLTKRRVKHKMVVRPLEILKPIPTPKRSLWGPARPNTRTRLDGDTSTRSFTFKLYVAYLLVGAMLLTVVTLSLESEFDWLEIMCAQLLGFANFCILGRLLDGLTPLTTNLNTGRVLVLLCITSWLRTMSLRDHRFDKILEYAQYFAALDALFWFITVRLTAREASFEKDVVVVAAGSASKSDVKSKSI
ncbi:Alkylglycerol monooxygenase [Hondaea fermentalgiana]|uniref:Alkylglycerol monooxygenase n=1 Tax=Hondaea fermentalgiana TaxID=2315210 RepID=A0A2R5GFH1_9STRA|nr:Alkylglycerol monooxygenase [Hondaea fermentalgiana]|eukprot:GBG26594.1 Alkylglycerol monooxygenase [Hondaea fermentalgiana]